MCQRRTGRDDCTKPTSVASGTDPYLLTHARETGFKVRRPPPRTVSGSSPTTCSSSSARSERGRRKPRGFRPNCSSCPQDLSPKIRAQAARSRMSSFPATSGAPGHGHHIEPLRFREVLRGAGQQVGLQALRGRAASSIGVPTPMRRCSVVLCQTTKITISGDFFSTKPSGGLEPPTPSLRCIPAATGRNPRQRFSPIWAVFAAAPFASGCHRLRPLGSINAPSVIDAGPVCGSLE